MLNAGLGKIVSVPLQDLDPEGGPFKTKKGKERVPGPSSPLGLLCALSCPLLCPRLPGTNITVRCLKLVRAFRKKMDDFDEEEDAIAKAVQPIDLVYEKDMLTQAYELSRWRRRRGRDPFPASFPPPRVRVALWTWVCLLRLGSQPGGSSPLVAIPGALPLTLGVSPWPMWCCSSGPACCSRFLGAWA